MPKLKRRIVVGDVQACFDSFQELLKSLEFDFDDDQLFLVGDMINRGPKNTEMIEWVLKHQNKIEVVLGNHELFFLANYFGIIHTDSEKDTVLDFIHHDRCDEFVEYLLTLNFIEEFDTFILVHAGIPTGFDIRELRNLNSNIKKTLQTKDAWKACLDIIFNSQDEKYLKEFRDVADWMKFFTMVRAVDKNTKKRVPRFSGSLSQLEQNQEAWFNSIDSNKIENKKIVFGHWAALGLHKDHRIVACDSACVWGEYLSAYILEENRYVSVSAIE